MLIDYDNEDIQDYTQWRHEFFDKMAPGEFGEKALEYEKEHPYTGNAVRL